jgi:5'-3' exoribonuclease 1
MGILSYYNTLLKTHPNIVINDINSIEIDHLYLDFNGFIHESLQNLKKNDNIINEKNILSQCCKDLKTIIELLKPRQTLYIAIDGVAPKAKMLQQRYRRYKSVHQQKEWDTNAITPGTSFMKKLYKKLQIFSEKLNIENIIIDNSENPGEGEHKILQYIKNNKKDGLSCINGLDADLIMLLLTLDQENLFIFREEQNSIKRHFVSIDCFRKEINIKNTKDYIFLCFMAGNDFLPHIPSIQIKFQGITQMIDLYSEKIIENNQINKTSFINFLQKLAEREEIMVSNISKKIQSQLLIEDTIHMGTNGWKRRYYNECFGTSEQNDIENICFKYWQGLQWVSQYYFDQCNDWSWYYPYRHAPCISDLLEVVKTCGTFEFPKINPYSSVQQLLIVLPPQSKELLPKSIQGIYDNIEFAHLFPIDYELDKIHKTQEWQCYPILPAIDESMFNVRTCKSYDRIYYK